MKLVLKNYNEHLSINCHEINLVYAESPRIFSNFVFAAATGFREDVNEPIYLFEEENRKLTGDVIWFVGDICSLDLGDKKS